MALAKKCDRCGNFYDNKSLDLCPSCKDSFEKWLNKKGDQK